MGKKDGISTEIVLSECEKYGALECLMKFKKTVADIQTSMAL